MGMRKAIMYNLQFRDIKRSYLANIDLLDVKTVLKCSFFLSV